MSDRERETSRGAGDAPASPADGSRPAGEDEGGRSGAWRDVERLLERKRLRERLRDVFDEELPDLDLPEDI